MVGFQRCLEVVFVNAQRNPHQHLPWALHHFAVHAQQVGALQGLQTEVVVVKIPFVDDGLV